MPDATDRLLSAATTVFSDNAEMQIAAERELRELLSRPRDPSPASATAEECAAALKGHTPACRRRWKLGVISAAVLSLGIAGWGAFQFHAARRAIKAAADSVYVRAERLDPALMAPSATVREQVILFGDRSTRDRSQQFKALWDLDRTNPAYFREYAFSHLRHKKSLPPESSRILAEIDPENGYFVMIEAGVHAEGCVDSAPPPKLKKGEPRPPLSWTIHDPKRMEEALAMLERAVAMPEWQPYDTVLLRKRFKILPKAEDTFARFFQAAYFNQIRAREPSLFPAMSVIAAKAEQCGTTGDVEGLRNLLSLWTEIVPRLFDKRSPTLLDSVVIRSATSSAMKNLEASAKSLGLTEDAERLRKQLASIPSSMLEGPPYSKELEIFLESRGSYQAAIAASAEQFRRGPAPVLTEQDASPGRLADYELASRAGALIGWAVFAIAAFLVAIYRFRGGSFARKLSVSFTGLLRASDWSWIMGGGVLVPFLLLEGLARFTPLGARDWNVGTHGLIVTAGQLLATLVLMLGMPLILARWRLGRRGALLGLGGGGQWVAKPMMALCLAALLLYGLGFLFSDPLKHTAPYSFADLDLTEQEGGRKNAFLIATIVAGTGLAWWLLTGVRALFGSHEKMLRRLVLSRLLLPAYTLAMLLMGLAMPLYHAAEKHWISRDRLMEMTADSAPLDRYSHGISVSYRNWLQNILLAED